MKKFIIICLLAITCTAMAVTETHKNKESLLEGAGMSAFKKVTITQTGAPPADFTETLNDIYGVLESVVIDATGTDTDYDIVIKDENGAVIFNGDALTTATNPNRYALSEADNAGTPNYFRGVRVAGQCTVEMAGGDDASLTAITVIIYYWQTWQ